MTVVTHVLTLW